MPYCPICKYEYRSGIETCPYCDAKLVAELPEPKLGDSELVVVRSYPFDVNAQEARIRLEANGIEAMIMNEIMSQTDIVLAFADGGVKVLVRKEDGKRAAQILAEM